MTTLKSLQDRGQLVAYIPKELSRNGRGFVLANLSEKFSNYPGAEPMYEFVTWGLEFDGQSCGLGHYFTGPDAKLELARALRDLTERTGLEHDLVN